MKTNAYTLLVAALVPLAVATPLERRAGCTTYTLIDTRGTGEAQGPSSGFRTMNSNIMSKLAGGKEYDTVYPASADQDSSAGTQDIINHITTTLQTNPNMCFVLEGYSQGAAATVNALPKLTGSAFAAVKGVFLIGDPFHKSGLTCNVDNMGGTTTRNVNGIEEFGTGSASIPSNWISKTLDVCIKGDGVCDSADGAGITPQHLEYGNDANTQNMGTEFVTTVLQGGAYSHM